MLGRWLVAALETTGTPITLPLAVDWRVLGFAALLAVATCLLFGLVPALRGTRVTASSVLRATTPGVGRPTDRHAPPRARRGADRAVGRAPLWLAVVRAYYATC